jgi:hypothetical protein
MMELIARGSGTEYVRQRTYAINNNIVPQYFDIDGISNENEFIPFYALYMKDVVYGGKVMQYSIPRENPVTRAMSNYKQFHSALKQPTYVKKFQTAAMEEPLYVTKGLVFRVSEGGRVEVLFTVAFKESYMMEVAKGVDALDKDQFRIFISESLVTEKSLNSFYRRLNKDIIMPHLHQGVDVIMTTNIADKCFNNNVEIPKFKSLTGLREYLNAFNKAI